MADINFYNEDCMGIEAKIRDTKYDLVILDPPFDKWHSINYYPKAKTYCCFTNFQNRRFVEDLFGRVPKFEMIWFFKDGRWVSNNMPRLTHEHILIYGQLRHNAFVGENNIDRRAKNKGKGCIGKDKNLGDRIYTPREKKMLNSVIEVPRNVSKVLGVWGKPIILIRQIMKWLTDTGESVWDGFAGSGTCGIVAMEQKLKYIGYEIDNNYYEVAMDRFNRHKQQLTLEL